MQIVVLAVFSLQAVVLSLVALLIARRLVEKIVHRIEQKLRARIEPLALNLLVDGTGTEQLARLRGPMVKGALEFVLLRQAREVDGTDRTRMTTAFEGLNLVGREIKALQARGWARRTEAATNLGIMGSQRAIEPLAAALRDRSEPVRLAALRSIGQIGGSQAVPVLVDALQQGQPWSVLRVAEALYDVGEELGKEFAPKFAPDQQAAEQIFLVRVSGYLHLAQAVPQLVDLMRTTKVPGIRAEAAFSLGLIGDPSAYDCLLTALSDPDDSVRTKAAAALGMIGDGRAAGALLNRLSDRSVEVQRSASSALVSLGSDGMAALEAGAKSSHPTVRAAATQTLAVSALGIHP